MPVGGAVAPERASCWAATIDSERPASPLTSCGVAGLMTAAGSWVIANGAGAGTGAVTGWVLKASLTARVYCRMSLHVLSRRLACTSCAEGRCLMAYTCARMRLSTSAKIDS
jgi:hypothetical protein